MGEKNRKTRLILALAALFQVALASVSAQTTEQSDSLLRLLSADYIEQVEIDEDLMRKAAHPVFLHNGTYLQSDTALWSQNNKIINFFGNVRMIQGDAELTSEKLDYYIDDDLAQFRGPMIELRNKEDNILRTRVLDYNTKDSLAVFRNGASMRSSDGQIIESDEGTYSNALSLFTFNGHVNMYTDSVFVRTSELDYDSKQEVARFKVPIYFWKDENMLKARRGWYRRADETFFFTGDVHGLGETQETWSDTLYYYRALNDVKMLGRVQMQDSSRNVASVSNYMYYKDTLSRVTLCDDAAVALWERKEERVDTTYCGADTLVYYAVKRCDIPQSELDNASKRLENIMGDPVSEFRKRASKEAEDNKNRDKNNGIGGARQGGAAARNGGNAPKPGGGEGRPGKKDSSGPDAAAGLDSLKTGPLTDSLKLAAPDSLSLWLDSLSVPVDSLSAAADTLVLPPPDTTKVGFMYGRGKVKIFRSDMQVVCDSVRFNELDSIARFHINPIVWNEGRRQYTADSLFVLVKKEGIDRANLMSNAFVTVQEDSLYYDQIKSTELLAYFGSEGELTRFDALGGVSCIFYLEENGELASVAKVEGKMMSTLLRDGELDRTYYFDQPKNNIYPIAQLAEKDRFLKGYTWQPELKPMGKEDITNLELRPSERSSMEREEHPDFPQTGIYFPGYMASVREQLALARQRKAEKGVVEDSRTETPADSLAFSPDTLKLHSRDSLLSAGLDSLSRKPFRDSLDVDIARDSVALSAAPAPDPKELKKAEREKKRQQRIAEKEARWAELDARDAAKAAEKERRKNEKKMRRVLRKLAIQAKEDARDKALLDKYVEFYQKQKEENERKQKSQPSREREQGAEAGGEISTPAER